MPRIKFAFGQPGKRQRPPKVFIAALDRRVFDEIRFDHRMFQEIGERHHLRLGNSNADRSLDCIKCRNARELKTRQAVVVAVGQDKSHEVAAVLSFPIRLSEKFKKPILTLWWIEAKGRQFVVRSRLVAWSAKLADSLRFPLRAQQLFRNITSILRRAAAWHKDSVYVLRPDAK